MGRAISVGRHQLPAFSVHCSATFTTSNVKLPATHLSSSSLALQQLALSSGVNSACLRSLSIGRPLRSMALPCATMSMTGNGGALFLHQSAALQFMSPTLLGHDVVTEPRLWRALGERRCRSIVRIALRMRRQARHSCPAHHPVQLRCVVVSTTFAECLTRAPLPCAWPPSLVPHHSAD